MPGPEYRLSPAIGKKTGSIYSVNGANSREYAIGYTYFTCPARGQQQLEPVEHILSSIPIVQVSDAGETACEPGWRMRGVLEIIGVRCLNCNYELLDVGGHPIKDGKVLMKWL